MSYGTTLQRRMFYAAPFRLKNMMASFYGYDAKRLRHGQAFAEHYRLADKFQWPSSNPEEECFRRTKDTLTRAAGASPYYKRLFNRAGFESQRMTSLQDLSKIPILQKEAFRENLEDIIKKPGKGETYRWVSTSGTTGTGLRFPETEESFQREYAYRYHNYAQGGIEMGDRWAICAGHPVANPTQQKPPFWVYDYCNNWLLMSSVHMTESNLVKYIDELKRFSPTMIGGYPSSVYLLALANDYCGRPVKAKAVYCASETLFERQRRTIEESFGCRALSYYGNAERCGFIAECERGMFHVRQEHSYLEILDENGNPVGPGMAGRIIGTGLGNLATPFIRYDVGDIGVLSSKTKCECGRVGPLLDSIVGRVEDYILTPDGRFVGRLDHLFKDARNVRMAQLYQEDCNSVEVRIVATPSYSAADENAILNEARLRLGNVINIDFKYTDDIERSGTGKVRFILSKIQRKQLFAADLATVPNETDAETGGECAGAAG